MGKLDDSELRNKTYQLEVMKSLTIRLCGVLFQKAKPVYSSDLIVDQLQEKFDETTDRNMKVKILSALLERIQN